MTGTSDGISSARVAGAVALALLALVLTDRLVMPAVAEGLASTFDLDARFRRSTWDVAVPYWTTVAVLTTPLLLGHGQWALMGAHALDRTPVRAAVRARTALWAASWVWTVAALVFLVGGRVQRVRASDLLAQTDGLSIWTVEMLQTAGGTVLVALLVAVPAQALPLLDDRRRRTTWTAAWAAAHVAAVVAVGWVAGGDYR